jgi:hypothetical protein
MLTQAIKQAVAPYLTGWRYPRNGERNCVFATWPKKVAGAPVAISPMDRKIDCVTLNAALLVAVYPTRPWTTEHYEGFLLIPGKRFTKDDRGDLALDAPLRAAEALGILDGRDAQPERWHLVQGWRHNGTGHGFLAYDRGNGRVDVLESTKIDLIGPRWRVATWKSLEREFSAQLFIGVLVAPGGTA